MRHSLYHANIPTSAWLSKIYQRWSQKAGLNVEVMVYDFFEEQPVKDADVYVYRWILYNWPDKYCVKILRALVPALKPVSRILVVEQVMPTPGVLPNASIKVRAVLISGF
ncbi:hypothetical protein GGR54DRAFT_618215 [Hypoxylon sp. NC1633]|nr:hypothetical protein GGR54DRAFT_618215 [Hypoxylon sp. NC1633]